MKQLFQLIVLNYNAEIKQRSWSWGLGDKALHAAGRGGVVSNLHTTLLCTKFDIRLCANVGV
jgi:hypothetical protein